MSHSGPKGEEGPNGIVDTLHEYVLDQAYSCGMLQSYDRRKPIEAYFSTSDQKTINIALYRTIPVYRGGQREKELVFLDQSEFSKSAAKKFFPEAKPLIDRLIAGDPEMDHFVVSFDIEKNEKRDNYNYLTNTWANGFERLCVEVSSFSLIKNGKLHHNVLPAFIDIRNNQALSQRHIQSIHFMQDGEKGLCHDTLVPSVTHSNVFSRDCPLVIDYKSALKQLYSPRPKQRRKLIDKVAEQNLKQGMNEDADNLYFFRGKAIPADVLEGIEWPLNETSKFTLEML